MWWPKLLPRDTHSHPFIQGLETVTFSFMSWEENIHSITWAIPYTSSRQTTWQLEMLSASLFLNLGDFQRRVTMILPDKEEHGDRKGNKGRNRSSAAFSYSAWGR